MSAMNDAPTDLPQVRAAAILGDGTTDTDALLAQAAAAGRDAGRDVRGLLMRYDGDPSQCACAMLLVDVATGDEYPVSQALGAGSASCRVDPQGFARASQVLRDALEPPAALVVVNRFGNLEADGGGLAAEMLALMAAGVPLLTVVPARHAQAWANFTGGAAVLPARREDVALWLDDVWRAQDLLATVPQA